MDSVTQISANFIKGESINDPCELISMAHDKKSIYHDVWGLKPASVIINMNFAIVTRALFENRIFKTIKIVKLKTKN